MRVRKLFDLGAEPARIAERLGHARGVSVPALRLPGAFDGYEIAIRAVLGQQISVKAATTIAGRFAAAFGDPVEMPFAEIRLLMPHGGTGRRCIAGHDHEARRDSGARAHRSRSIARDGE